jgi:hypothetical protein
MNAEDIDEEYFEYYDFSKSLKEIPEEENVIINNENDDSSWEEIEENH